MSLPVRKASAKALNAFTVEGNDESKETDHILWDRREDDLSLMLSWQSLFQGHCLPGSPRGGSLAVGLVPFLSFMAPLCGLLFN